jgi:hypothetical protein
VLMDNLRDLPGREALRLRAEVSQIPCAFSAWLTPIFMIANLELLTYRYVF